MTERTLIPEIRWDDGDAACSLVEAAPERFRWRVSTEAGSVAGIAGSLAMAQVLIGVHTPSEGAQRLCGRFGR